jgi:hypothetical protein
MRRDDLMSRPTEEAYPELQAAYDLFNTHLFEAQLPPCLITMQRKNRSYGYFSPERWSHVAGAVTDEIALNPAHFASRSTAEVLSTLAHEMVHLWQHHFGSPSRNGYHNKEWASKMDTIGLMPSDTGESGGKRTGQAMTHCIVDGGPFAQVCADLLREGFVISWRDRRGEEPEPVTVPGSSPSEPPLTPRKRSGVRTKYTCPACGMNAWAKPETLLRCGLCELLLLAEAQ